MNDERGVIKLIESVAIKDILILASLSYWTSLFMALDINLPFGLVPTFDFAVVVVSVVVVVFGVGAGVVVAGQPSFARVNVGAVAAVAVLLFSRIFTVKIFPTILFLKLLNMAF